MTNDRIPDGDQNPAVIVSDYGQGAKGIKKLIEAKDYDTARTLALHLVNDDQNKLQAYRLLAEIAEKKNELPEAVRNAKAALDLAPKSSKSAQLYLRLLNAAENYRAALDFFRRLPKKTRSNRDVRREMSSIYADMGWHGHSYRLKREDGVKPRGLTQRVLSLAMRFGLASMLIRLERRQHRRLQHWSPGYTEYDAIKFASPEQALEIKGQIDKAVVTQIRVIEWTRFMRYVLEAGFFVVAAVAGVGGIFLLNSPIPLAASIPMAGAIASTIFVASGKIWDSARSRGGAFRLTMPLVLLSAIVGIVLAATPLRNYSWLALVAAGLLSGAILFEVAVLGDAMGNIAAGYWFRYHRRRNARAVTVDLLMYVVLQLDDERSRLDLYVRDDIVDCLEFLSETIERDVPEQIPPRDSRTHAWFEERLSRVAESLREMKKYVLAPTSDSWEALSKMLHHQLTAIATDNWGSALQQKPPARSPKRRRDQISAILRFVAVATLPAITLLFINLATDLGSSFLRWSIVFAAGWAVLSILFVLDPSFREKVETARGLASTSREISDKGK